MSTPTIFLKLYVDNKPVLGDATAQDYVGQIELDSFSWEITNKNSDAGGTEASTELRPKVVKLVKVYDRSSTHLARCLVEQKEFSVATITMISHTMVGSQDKSPKLMTLQLSKGRILSIDLDASGSSKSLVARESLTLAFNRCKLMHYPVDRDRPGREAPSTFEHELANNKLAGK